MPWGIKRGIAVPIDMERYDSERMITKLSRKRRKAAPKNETHHWCACECGIVTVSAEHTYGEDGACTECGYRPGVDLILSEDAAKKKTNAET